LDAVVELSFQLFDPSVSSHTWPDSVHGWIAALVVDLVKALLHRALELVGNLRISVTVEDTPGLQGWLREHLCLDLTIEVTSALLDVELVRSTAARRTHNQISSVILVALHFSWSVLELEMPSLLLLLALLVGGECGEEMLALLDLLVGVGVDNLGQVLHQPEVGSHGVCQTCELAELWNEGYLITSLAVLVDEEWLVWVGDILVVSGLVVLLVAHLGTVLVEGGLRAHTEVKAVDSVSLLVVPCDNS